jgi:hypothetical protein
LSIGALYTIGSGAMHGTLGTVLGIGDITPDGGTATLVGHTIGIGVTAMHSITITTIVHSITVIPHVLIIMICIGLYPIMTTQTITEVRRLEKEMKA